MKYLVLLVVLVASCQLTQGVLEWIVSEKITEYGQNVTLFCNVSNCCPKLAGWDKYTPVQRTLFIDVKTGLSTKKYDGKILKDGYTLIIQNLTKQDLNVSYSCVYDYTIGDKQTLLEDNVFMYKTSTQPNGPFDKRSFSGGKIAGIILGVSASMSLVFIVIWFWRHKKKSYKHNIASSQGSTEDVPFINFFLEEPIDCRCIEGENAILTCKIRADSPSVKWLKNGIEITQNEKCMMSTVDTLHRFTLMNTTEGDSGEYLVQVGNFSKTIQLYITDWFLDDPANIECIEGEDATITCKIRPDCPFVKFLKDGNTIKTCDYCLISMVNTQLKLKLLQTTKLRDDGEYVVQVGKFTRKVHLNIIDYFLEEPIDSQCLEGDDAILTCKIRANSPSVKWLKNGKEITQNEKCIISTVDTQHKLTLKNSTAGDRGDYYVQVGKFSKKIQLNITEIPREISVYESNGCLEEICSGVKHRYNMSTQSIGKDCVGKLGLVRSLPRDTSCNVECTDGTETNSQYPTLRNTAEWVVGEDETMRKETIRRVVALKAKQTESMYSLLRLLQSREYNYR